MTALKNLSLAVALAFAGCVTEYDDGSEIESEIESSLVGDDIIRLTGPTKYCGGTTSVRVWLSAAPVAPMVVTLTAPGVLGPRDHTFTPDNWTTAKVWYLTSGGTVAATSPGYPSKSITIRRLYCL